MTQKPKPPTDDPEQSKRFIDMARDVGADERVPNFERLFQKVAEQPKGLSLDLRVAVLVETVRKSPHKCSDYIENVPRRLLRVDLI